MQLLADRSFVQSPGTCIVCNRAPDEGQPVVDTLHNLTVGIPTVDGRIYVCFGCANSIANTIGFVSDEVTRAAVAEAAQAVAEAAVVKARAEAIFQEFNAPVEIDATMFEPEADDEPEADEEE
jgi:hypothetical protein